MRSITKIAKRVQKIYPQIIVAEKDNCVQLTGVLDDWQDVVAAGKLAVSHDYLGVLNDVQLAGFTEPPMKVSAIVDDKYDGKRVDVLVIGGGVVGCAILRELTKYNITSALVEKENDVALAASSRNDGAIHVGIDLHGETNKIPYLMRSNPRYEKLSKELGFKFDRKGQYLAFDKRFYFFAIPYLALRAKRNGVKGMKYISRRRLFELVPNANPDTKFALFFPSGGIVCPYGMTIAYANNAVTNGGEILLETAVTGMKVKQGLIESVSTNRGVIYPKVVINAAGVFCDKIAEMADDRTFTIHPRRGTNCILDKNSVDHLMTESISMYGNSGSNKKMHTKGGGILPTVDKNLLVGPDAVETPYREDMTTTPESVFSSMNRQKTGIAPNLNNGDIITYFTGVRAATYEENFVIRKGVKTFNIVHAAGIQSPGLSAAPAIAEDAVSYAIDILRYKQKVLINNKFDPVNRGVVDVKQLSESQRDELIAHNPDYGEIVCRCEGISKGEIIDALNMPLKVSTVDGVKRRVRAGMGRCQGGFCQPLVLKIISEQRGIDYEQVKKRGDASILLSDTKESL